jgi:methionyl-tRNA synthetase
MICSDEKRNNLNKYTMTEKTKQLIETGKTIERLYENGKIEIGAYTILIDRNKQAINYSRCCEELKAECECNKGKNGEGMDLVRDFNKAFRSL